MPSKKKPYAKATSLPGWNEFVAPAKDAALFWHSVWLSAQRPRSGQLYSIMCSTRNKYHYVVKKVKRAADSLDARRLVDASQEGNLMLMKEIKKTLRSKKIKQDVPDEIDGKVTPETIIDRFRECYQRLYNSAGSDNAMEEICRNLEAIIGVESHNSYLEVQKITGKSVKEACRRMLPGKCDVTGS